MKLFVKLFLLVVSFQLNAQNLWFETDINTEINVLKPKDVIPIINDDNGNIALFFINSKVAFGKLHNEEGQLIGSINNISIPKKGKKLIGVIYEKDWYTLFFSNNNNNHLSSVSVNFNSGNFSFNEDLDIDLKNQKIIDFIIEKNRMFVLTVSTKNNILYSYKATKNEVTKGFTYDLSDKNFADNNNTSYELDLLLFGNSGYSSVEVIDNTVPNGLEKTNAFTKLYYKETEGTLIITNNVFDKYTYLINLNFNNGNSSFKVIENSGFNKDDYYTNSNSFIFSDKIITVYSSKDHLDLSLYSLNSLEKLKTFKIIKDEAINFKNTPIIQEGGEFDNYRELEKTSKFLRKITNSKIGVTAYQKKDYIVLTLGASTEIQTNPYLAGTFGAIGGVVSGALISSFNSYSKTKSTRIECLFDSEFNHLKGNIPNNNYDKIIDFKNNNFKSYDSSIETLFKNNNDYIFGVFNKETGLYSLYKFPL